MKKPIKILQIGDKKECTYFIIRDGVSIRSKVPRKVLKKLINTVKPDLIFRERDKLPIPWEKV